LSYAKFVVKNAALIILCSTPHQNWARRAARRHLRPQPSTTRSPRGNWPFFLSIIGNFPFLCGVEFADAFAAMTFALDPPRRARAVRCLLLQWRPDDIAREVHCPVNTIYNLRRNLWMYGTPTKSPVRTRGRPRKMTKAAEDLLLQYLNRNPVSDQDEMG
jgi:hypothetical protein